MGGQALPKHAKRSHWPLQSCRSGHLHPADPDHPTCCWVSPPALSSAAFWSCTLPVWLLSPHWPLEDLSASHLLYSVETRKYLRLYHKTKKQIYQKTCILFKLAIAIWLKYFFSVYIFGLQKDRTFKMWSKSCPCHYKTVINITDNIQG